MIFLSVGVFNIFRINSIVILVGERSPFSSYKGYSGGGGRDTANLGGAKDSSLGDFGLVIYSELTLSS